jgi:hypothetical protein
MAMDAALRDAELVPDPEPPRPAPTGDVPWERTP